MMRAQGGLVIALLSAVLSCPLAGALSVEGEFVAAPSLVVDAPTNMTLRPIVLLAREPSLVSSFSLRQPDATLCLHKLETTEIVAADQTVRLWTLPEVHCERHRELTLTLSDGAEGWIGLLPNESGVLRISVPRLHLEGRISSDVASEGAETAASTDDNAPEYPFVAKRIREPHLFVAGAANLTYSGEGLLKVLGPDVHVRSDRGERSYATGRSLEEEAGRRVTSVRWVSLYLAGSILAMEASGLEIGAHGSPSTEWSGSLILTPLEGNLRAAGLEYVGDGGAEQIIGRFHGTFNPVDNGRALRVTVTGDLEATSLKAYPRLVPAAAEGRTSAWAAVALVGLAVVVAGGAAALLLRRPERRPMRGWRLWATSGEEDPVLVAARIARRRPREAVAILQGALRAEPRHGQAWLDLGHIHFDLLDEVDNALEAFEWAIQFVRTGEPEAMAALCHLRRNETDAAEERLVAALRAPALDEDTIALILQHRELQELLVERELTELWDATVARVQREMWEKE